MQQAQVHQNASRLMPTSPKKHIARVSYHLLDKSRFLDGFIQFVEEAGVKETQQGGIPIQEFYASYVTFCEEHDLPVYSDSWVGVRMSQCGLKSVRKQKLGYFPVKMEPPTPSRQRKSTPQAMLLREQNKLLEAEAAALRDRIKAAIAKVEDLRNGEEINDDAYLELLIVLGENAE